MRPLALLCGVLVSTVTGHIQMSKPYPIRSPLNPNVAPSIRDYSYTSPLSASGVDFPCKGYAQDPFGSVTDYTAGERYSMTLAGTATHGGGSCQISLSYDGGETFRVIKSILGQCPNAMAYTFQIPDDAPQGPALLAWTWFNKVGNREMYMDCAQVTVRRGAAVTDDEQQAPPNSPAPIPWADRPTIFVANINAESQCTTVEGEEVNFPQPGPEVEGSLSGRGYECAAASPFAAVGDDQLQPHISSSSTLAVLESRSSSRSMHGGSSLTSTAAGTDYTVAQTFGVSIVNHLNSDLHTWSVAETSGPEILIPAGGGSYFEKWRTRDDGGGISIKMALEASQNNILQFEYTLLSSIVYWDVSFIDMNRDSDFIARGIQVSTNDPHCPGLRCSPGDQDCSSVYLEPDDDQAVRGCLMQTNLTLSIGG